MDEITLAFTPLIGTPCWGVERGQGSILSFEFGTPRLSIREPYVSTSSFTRLQQMAGRRRVKPVGEWNLFIFCCHWHVTLFSEALAHDESTQEQIDVTAHAMDGQKLIAITLDAATRAATFSFDLGGIMTTWPYEANKEEQWSLYMPGSRVLTYRADGRYSLAPRDGKAGQEVWR